MSIKNIDKYKFEDLFDLNEIQKLSDTMAMALEVGVVIVSPDGVPLTKPSNYCYFCSNIVRKSPIGAKNCAYSDAVLGRQSDAPITSKCLSAGLTDAGISISIDGKHLASWMIGQVRIEDDMLSEEELRERARNLEIEEELFVQRIQSVPIKTKEQFDRILQMVQIMAQIMSEQGLLNYLQKEKLQHQEQMKESLLDEMKELENSHKYDKVTGLCNRSYYEEQLEELIKNKRYPIVVISGDMNNLKLYNDVFGHLEGDSGLRALGEIFRKEAGDDFIMARYGGDEFSIAIPRARKEVAEDFCNRVHSACVNITDAMIPPSISLGYYVLESEETELSYAVRQAEEAMYKVKMEKKRNQNIQRDIMEILYRKQFLAEKQVNETVNRTVKFARFMELDEYNIQLLELAARLQDVGLIGVPERVVKKETQRNREEYDLMAKHTEIGYRLARLYDESFQVSEIILQSHECWSGQGYPHNLKGRAILYNARILYMVGTYSGWIFPRPTGSGMTVKAARLRLQKEAGQQFDPDMVARFLQYLEQEEAL